MQILFSWILAGICALLGLFVIIAAVMFCSRNGKKLFRKAFSIQDIEIPEKMVKLRINEIRILLARNEINESIANALVDIII